MSEDADEVVEDDVVKSAGGSADQKSKISGSDGWQKKQTRPADFSKFARKASGPKMSTDKLGGGSRQQDSDDHDGELVEIESDVDDEPDRRQPKRKTPTTPGVLKQILAAKVSCSCS